jgi:hypothetical protein
VSFLYLTNLFIVTAHKRVTTKIRIPHSTAPTATHKCKADFGYEVTPTIFLFLTLKPNLFCFISCNGFDSKGHERPQNHFVFSFFLSFSPPFAFVSTQLAVAKQSANKNKKRYDREKSRY